MSRCWEVAPTSAWVIQDIEGFELVLDRIIAADGTIVLDEGLRHGRRALKHNGSGLLKYRLTAVQRKDTLKLHELHDDVQYVRTHLLQEPDGIIKIEQVLNNVENRQDKLQLAAAIQEGIDIIAEVED